MYKDIILLTTSKKSGNYCIAGVEKERGNWIRIISEDDRIQHAIRSEDMIYENGNKPQIMDIVRIKCKGIKPNYYQPENYILDNSVSWQKIGRTNIQELLNIHCAENKQFVFFNSDKYIDSEFIKTLNDEEKYSLTLISPEDVCIHVKRWPERQQITMSFIYNGYRYNFMPITDTEFENIYLKYQDGNYNYQDNCLLVISLGDIYEKDYEAL
ncbi:MAG TPA: hypothetical protein DCK76_12135 [Desulfotomaculum sp.]|nr:hypothetical protein [Desulfotomaculum sp.]HBY04907.1 hypothetical protein [Desulfotomaculum sp.]